MSHVTTTAEFPISPEARRVYSALLRRNEERRILRTPGVAEGLADAVAEIEAAADPSRRGER
jgi:hypothetical protein